jgi:hypothetical protein
MISQITPNLFIGEYLDVVGNTPEETAAKHEALKKMGIYNVVSLCTYGIEDRQIEEEKKAFSRNFPANMIWYHHQPVPCENLNHLGHTDPLKAGLELALYEVHRITYVMPTAKVLIHCTAGIDRSPFVVASYMVRYQLYSLSEAYKEIKKVRPFVCEHPEWVWWKKQPVIQIQSSKEEKQP